MKKYLYLLGLALFACDVERLPEDTISDASFWTTESDLRAASNYLYTFLPQLPNPSDTWSDHAFGTLPDPIGDGTRLVPATATDYNQPYQLIRAACNIIEKSKISLRAGVRPEVVTSYVGEAMFFRAWAYFQLVQKYGDVPLILTLLKEDSPELQAPRTPREEVIEAIYNDLDESIRHLPSPSQRSGANYGRISNTAALSLKARVGLFEGTRSKFHSYGDPQKHLRIAVDASRKVIESGEHALFGDYYSLFQQEGEGPQNKENILVRIYGNSINDDVSSYNSGSITDGSMNPTKALIDSYLTKEGLPADQSAAPPDSFLVIFEGRDERLAASVMKPGDPYILGRIYGGPALTWNVTGYCPRKFVVTTGINAVSYIDYPIIRYAEVLLTYAEATFELNGQITDDDLNQTINLLRARGGVKPLSNAFAAQHNLAMRDEIRRERGVELAMEGFRYWDLLRWKTAETELPKDILGSYFFKDAPGFNNANPNLTSDNYIVAHPASNRSFDPKKHYLWPLPVNELAFNLQLKQNPGWD